MSAPLRIKNHRIDGIPFEPARWTGGAITPTIIVLHDTASRLTKGAAANYLRDNSRKVSVHFVVERDGSITQQVACNRRANHAGVSSYHGRRYCNGFSIGIEIVNPGVMTPAGLGKARAWYKQIFDTAENDIHQVTTKEHGSGLWMDYTEAQIEAVEAICVACFEKYPSLIDVTTHWYIAPRRKTDTNPLFPLEQIRSRVLGREEPTEEEADNAAAGGAATDAMVSIVTPGDSLNMRRWPSFNPNVITAIPHGTEVPLLKTGTFDGRRWHKVIYDGADGWVIARYTNTIDHEI